MSCHLLLKQYCLARTFTGSGFPNLRAWAGTDKEKCVKHSLQTWSSQRRIKDMILSAMQAMQRVQKPTNPRTLSEVSAQAMQPRVCSCSINLENESDHNNANARNGPHGRTPGLRVSASCLIGHLKHTCSGIQGKSAWCYMPSFHA